jgi:hypothetical protein
VDEKTLGISWLGEQERERRQLLKNDGEMRDGEKRVVGHGARGGLMDF